jgi:hypothetical protein
LLKKDALTEKDNFYQSIKFQNTFILFRIALALKSNSTSWVLSTAAALFWRVKGNSEQAVKCLRHSLYYSPRDMKDIPLISLANVLHRAGN